MLFQLKNLYIMRFLILHKGGRIAKFIVISNELFEYRDTYGFAKVRFIQYYDMAKQVVLPYNDQVIRLLDFDDWHRIC